MRHFLTSILIVFFVGFLFRGCAGAPTPTPTSSPKLPDLVVTDIILKPTPVGDQRGGPNEVIVNTVVKNIGADCKQGFIVLCSFPCAEKGSVAFSGMKATNGLGGNQEITLGDDSYLSINCPIELKRDFTCTVDYENDIVEADESNNTYTEKMLTNR